MASEPARADETKDALQDQQETLERIIQDLSRKHQELEESLKSPLQRLNRIANQQ